MKHVQCKGRRWTRGVLAAMGMLAILSGVVGCAGNSNVRALNGSREVLSLRLVGSASDNGVDPIAGAVMGPMGRFIYEGPVSSHAELRIRRWEDGREVGDVLIVDVPRGTDVQATIDVSEGRLLLRDASTRELRAW